MDGKIRRRVLGAAFAGTLALLFVAPGAGADSSQQCYDLVPISTAGACVQPVAPWQFQVSQAQSYPAYDPAYSTYMTANGGQGVGADLSPSPGVQAFKLYVS